MARQGTGTQAAPSVETVTTGAARSLGEPAAAQDTAVSAVTATVFKPTGAVATVWTKPAGTSTWTNAGQVLPPGFGTSYDPAISAAPGGPLLVVAGTAPPNETCVTTNGSVAIANVDSQGRLGAARLVSDQRGTGSFDDRPTVLARRGGTVWVAWSQGPASDACQDVGTQDQIEVAVSHDGGMTFAAPVTMPAGGGHSAFGVRLAPLPGGQVAVSWTETMAAGIQALFISVLGPSGQPGQPELVLSGQGPPSILPGATFLDFPAGDIVALPGGDLAVAMPFWLSGQSVIELAVGAPGGQWQQMFLRPPSGSDLLLPALGLLSPDDVRVVCAVHTRVGDRLGYDWTDLRVTSQGASLSAAGLTALTPAPRGRGFHEIGEELALAPTPGGLLTSVVVAGRNVGATLETAAFKAPVVATPASSAATPTTSGQATQASTGTAQAGTSGHLGATALLGALAVVMVLGCSVVVLIARARAAKRRRAAAWRSGQYYPPAGRPAQYQPNNWQDSRQPPRPPERRPGGQPAPYQPDRRQPSFQPNNWPDSRQPPRPPDRRPDGQPAPYQPDRRQPSFQPNNWPDSRQPPRPPDRRPDGQPAPYQPDSWQSRLLP